MHFGELFSWNVFSWKSLTSLDTRIFFIFLDLFCRHELFFTFCFYLFFLASCSREMQPEHPWQGWRHPSAWSTATSHSVSIATVTRYARCWQGEKGSFAFLQITTAMYIGSHSHLGIQKKASYQINVFPCTKVFLSFNLYLSPDLKF